MPEVAKDRSPRDVKRLSKRPGIHSVGGVAGLYLLVSDTLAASWVFRKRYGELRPVGKNGKLERDRHSIGLGPYPEVSLKAARERATTASEQIRNGIDPLAVKREAQAKLAAGIGKRMRFDEAARAAHKVRAAEFKNPKHAKQWIATLETYAFPVLGAMDVADIETAHVMKVVEPLWLEKTETASRVRGRIENVIDWAKARGLPIRENPARWTGHLDELLQSPKKVKKVAHHAALPWREIPAFVSTLRARKAPAARALEFAILTAARSEQTREATWSEIDLGERLWVISAERMKGEKGEGREHRVPLSDAAVRILEAVPRSKRHGSVFLGPNGKRLSANALGNVIERMHESATAHGGPGYVDPSLLDDAGKPRVVTAHGMRSSFKDFCRHLPREKAYADEISELALAHVSDDKTRAAYARSDLVPVRAQLMEDWAEFCGSAKKATVTKIGKRAKPRRRV